MLSNELVFSDKISLNEREKITIVDKKITTLLKKNFSNIIKTLNISQTNHCD